MVELLIFGSMIALLAFTRLPLGYILMFCGLAGIANLHPRGFGAALGIAEGQVLELAMNYQFSVLPLFILMGVFVVRAGLAEELFTFARSLLGHRRGGIGLATILACGGFSAMSASSSAAAATMARIAVPEMEKVRYDSGFAAGTVAAGGTMGILIPPSSALIIYALLTQLSVSQLFMAGAIPGLLQIGFYMLVMVVVGVVAPSWAPHGARSTWRECLQATTKIWGILLLFGVVMLGIVLGWFTATEAGGIGAGGALLFVAHRRKLTWKVLTDSLEETARISTMIFIVAAGAQVLNQFINFTGITGHTVDFINALALPSWAVILCLIGFYVLLGCLLDGFAMIFLTVPVIAPIVAALGYDLVWWGVVTVIVVEISLITPPVGLNVFILKAMLEDLPLVQIFKGILPFLLADVLRLVLLLLFPALALWLPGIFG